MTPRSSPGATRSAPLLGLLLLLGVGASPAWAHPDHPVAPHDLWSAWSGDPWVLLGLLLAVALYGAGTRRLWRRAGTGRGIPRWRAWSYAGGIAALLLALVSPLDALGGALFSAHMVQHEVLILVAAPLLVLGAPLVAYVWALPPAWRRRAGAWAAAAPVRASWRWIAHPLSAWTLHAAAVWIWHAPRLYQATLTSDLVHALQHASFFGTAMLFWWTLLHPSRHRRLDRGVGVLYVFTTAVYGSALGALLTFSPTTWYPVYAGSVAAWGLTPLEDQQLGGLIMWIPFGAVYTVVAIALLAAWLREMETRVGGAESMRPRAVGGAATPAE